jgi:ABC-type glycerol-3-phosphate transport system substrate-binding protein
MKNLILSATTAFLLGSVPVYAQGVTLHVPSWMWEEGQVGEWFKRNTADYEAASGNNVSQTQIPAADFEKVVITQIAGGAVPDLMTVFTSMLPPMINAGTLAPLDACIAEGGFGDRLLKSVDFAKVDGATYGVPLTMSPWSAVVNRKLLTEAGIEEMPRTIEELYAAAVAVKEKTGGYGYAFGNDMAAPLHVYINSMQWVLGFGSDWSQPDGTITANDPRNIEAISWLKRFLDEGLAPIGLGIIQARDLFLDGQVAIMFEGPWLMTQVQGEKPEMMADIDFEVVPTPTHAAITGGAFFVIPAKAANPDQACDLLTTYLEEEAQRRWLEDLLQIPGTTAEPSAEFLEENAWVGNMAEIAAQYPGGIGYAPPGYLIEAGEFRQMVVDSLSEIFSGRTSVEEGLNGLQTKLENWSATL